jgi:hypothetical protein
MEALLGDATQTDAQDVTTERSSAEEAPKTKLLQAKLVGLPKRPAEGEDKPGRQQPPEEGKDKRPP